MGGEITLEQLGSRSNVGQRNTIYVNFYSARSSFNQRIRTDLHAAGPSP